MNFQQHAEVQQLYDVAVVVEGKVALQKCWEDYLASLDLGEIVVQIVVRVVECFEANYS